MLRISVVQLQRLTEMAREIEHPDRDVPAAVAPVLEVVREMVDARAVRLDLPGREGVPPLRLAVPDDPPLPDQPSLTAVLTSARGREIGELVATRHATDPPFEEADHAVLAFVGTLVSSQIESRREADAGRTARRRLGRGREQVQLLLDLVPSGIVGIDANERYVYANAAAAELTRRQVSEILQSRPADAPWEVMAVDGSPRSRAESPILRAVRGQYVRGEVVGLRFEDGATRWLHVTAAPVRLDGRRDIVGAVAGFVDVTDQVELQRQLDASEARLRASERAAGVGSWELDVATRQVVSSEALHELLGLDIAERFELGTYVDLLVPEDRVAVERSLNETMQHGVLLSTRGRIQRPDGAIRVIALLGEATLDAEGRVRTVVGTLRDITDEIAEQERLRRAQRLESIGRLAGGLAHDLNNFLTVLAGHAELLSESATADQADSVASIIRATDRAATLTRQLLEVGRREALQPRTFDVNALLESQRATIRQILPGAVELRWELIDDPPPVKMDPSKFEQVLLNLVLNASDAVGVSGVVTIRSSVAQLGPRYGGDLSPSSTSVCVAVSDSGTGMSPEVLARAFEPFFSTKARDRGTGLGLSTSRGIMEQSGGQLELDSELGRGTTVRILLPISDEPIPVERTRPAATDVALHGTVLVAEDDDQVRELTVAALRRAGCTVLVAVDGPDAVREATQHTGRIDLLVTDVSMPGFGGQRTAQEVLALHPGAQVLYISGYTERSVVLQELTTGDVDLLAKPFSVSELVAKVDAALARATTR